MPTQIPSGEATPALSSSSLPPDAPRPQQQTFSGVARATPLPPAKPEEKLTLDSDTQSQDGDLYTLKGHVEIHYEDRTLYADTITYNKDTSQLTLEGNVKMVGGENNEYIQASHGDYDLATGTGHFYDVNGSIQLRTPPAGNAPTSIKTTVVGPSAPVDRTAYTNENPFLFWGREVVKNGPNDYTIYDGSVTSCLLPHPDWQLYSNKFKVANGSAHAGFTTFRLLGIPVLFLPYASHPTDTTQRQSGLLIPVFGYSSASNNTGSKGITIGEQVYVVVNRSVDFTIGTIFYSLRGFSENGTIRVKGPGDDYLTGHFTALQDRGFYQPTQTGVVKVTGAPIISNVYTNQGGEDLTLAFRYRFNPATRLVGDGEYLSSYIYREAFTENFNQAVSSDITSTVFLTHESNGRAADLRFDRYEGLKVVPVADHAGEEVKIFHVPSIDFSGVDTRIPGTPFFYNIAASAAAMKRIEPKYTSDITGRVDLRPEISLPLHFGGWHVMASAAVRETVYTDSRKAPYLQPNAAPVLLGTALNRADFDLNIDIRPPAIERTFTVPERWQHLFGTQVRHTIEPEITYRDVRGVDNFLNVLRFDDTDLVSDTNELRYGVLQHLYFRPRKLKPRPGCPAVTVASELEEEAPHATTDANGIPIADTTAPDRPTRTHVKHADPCAPVGPPPAQEWFTWEVAQKTFFDQNFGGAVINQRRNIFETTLNLSGIAFLTEARAISPVISRMRFRTNSHADIEWDFDYDTGAKKFTSSNTFLDVHEGNWFGGFSYAQLNAPGRFYSEDISSVTNTVTKVTSSATSNFSQMRVLLGYGSPTRPGLALGGGAGIDLKERDAQYTTLQAGYNWNCCGLSVEFRQYNLGPVRDENSYRFNFTLANIGSAGNLRRSEALF